MIPIDWSQLGALGGITVVLIFLFSWVTKRILNWVMALVNAQITAMREDVHSMTQAAQKASAEFTEYLREDIRYRNHRDLTVTGALQALTNQIQMLMLHVTGHTSSTDSKGDADEGS